jgi:hypothetical protein
LQEGETDQDQWAVISFICSILARIRCKIMIIKGYSVQQIVWGSILLFGSQEVNPWQFLGHQISRRQFLYM